MRRLVLEQLLDGTHSDATFHDSELEHLNLNFAAGSASLIFRVPIGVADRELTYARGELVLTGLLFFAVEQPNAPLNHWSQAALWITADGPFPDPAVKFIAALPPDIPDGAFCHYLFSSNTNSFIVFAATEARFAWNAV